MKNFPSSLIKQKSTKQGLADSASGTLKNIGSKVLKNIFGGGDNNPDLSISGLDTKFSDGYEVLDIEHEIDTIDINKFHKSLPKQSNSQDIDSIMHRYNETVSFNANIWNGNNIDDVYFEDPFLFSSSIFSVINNYKYILKSSVPTILQHPAPKNPNDEKSDYQMIMAHSVVSPSLFNPFNGVDVTGITEHVPLLITGNKDLKSFSETLEKGYGDNEGPGKAEVKDITLQSSAPQGYDQDIDLSDCTIKKLVEISNEPKGGSLGLATYRYADFMFCKDLGKISNNHLITLRKFPGPIGDNIFQEAFPDNGKNIFAGYPDIGRMVTWFGNEDNKLEDICKFNYRATWKAFTAEIQPVPSEQKDEGILDKIANSFSPQNNKMIEEGFSGNTGLLRWGSAMIELPIIGNQQMANSQYYGWHLLENYDQHRIYQPQNTIWDTHKYEGKLEFNQEITLTFRYVLRSYANINPKSAFLDLLGNIMLVTYRRGSFWGGETKIIGPQGNNSVYKTVDALIDKSFDKLGGMWSQLTTGQFGLQQLQGWISDAAKAIMNKGAEVSDTVAGLKKGEGVKKENVKNDMAKTAKELEKANKHYGWTNAIKGMIKNQLGRPAMYAVNSILTGEAVGPWHLTIGNPRNPIMSMGNMIIDSPVEIQQSGPLGIDDFPSEIKVVVTLKHGRPRDAVEIEKMYTKGRSAIYKPMNLMLLKEYKNNPYAFGDIMNISKLTDVYTNDAWIETKTVNGKETKIKHDAQEIKLSESVFKKILSNI